MADISLTFPDGSARHYPAGITGLALAESISKSLAKKAVAIVLDEELIDLADPIDRDATVKIVTPHRRRGARVDPARLCPTSSAEAVQELFPGTQVTIGPVIENGFFYDFARDETVPSR